MGVPNKLLTLVFVHKDSKVLLGMKKRGFGVNRWNGFGGKVQKGETIEEGAKSMGFTRSKGYRKVRGLNDDVIDREIVRAGEARLTTGLSQPYKETSRNDLSRCLEMLEESCLTVKHLTEIARIDFEFVGEEQILEVHVFKTDQFEGEPTETEEMRPKWFSVNDIPFKEMWPDDILWFPHLLNGTKFNGYFKFKGHDEIVDYTIKEVS
ncbi:7,8-dihydro-8-oxoguanine triphosphatase [Holothuria leucospilota]|uniref:7,8-dihydro-8-oxoguanine triphosphatase n=1 Tax=Holothuria leucospilota TaxID=206669 RepID=A0A9Q1C299_HOLLE|nr:7,8-dihydro-8-oxoguanine triphosphatase [Holothuria leucospilota]